MKALRMQHADDPADAITAKTKDIVKLVGVVNPYEVLVAIYTRPRVTSGGIHLPDQNRDEDIHQGKAGLIIAMGSLAFTDDEKNNWGTNPTPKIGDWVAFRGSDSWQLLLGDQHCRMVPDRYVRLILKEPDVVF